MKKIVPIVAASLLLVAGVAQAASHIGAPMAPDGKTAIPAASTASMTEGEIRKVDMESKKITIKHGEIKNLDMPGMTMVFGVKDPDMLTKLKSGDKVKFSAEKVGGALMVTDIQPAK